MTGQAMVYNRTLATHGLCIQFDFGCESWKGVRSGSTIRHCETRGMNSVTTHENQFCHNIILDLALLGLIVFDPFQW